MKEEPTGAAAAAVAAVEKHFAMHGLYGMPPSTGSVPNSPQAQRQMKHSSAREEAHQDELEQEFLSAQHSKLYINS